jgi:hypothetical protein
MSPFGPFIPQTVAEDAEASIAEQVDQARFI